LEEDISVKRFTLVGFLALMGAASFAYADSCTTSYAGVTTFNPGLVAEPAGNPPGFPGSQAYAPGGPALNNITTSCANVGPNPSDPTAARTSFINSVGQSSLDTINWEVNPVDCGTEYCLSYPNSPYYADGYQGANAPPYPSPPYGGGVNGTGYTFGEEPNSGGNTLGLTLTNNFATMPGFPGQNMLAGTLSLGNDLALTWDTSTTGATYNLGAPEAPGANGQTSCGTGGDYYYPAYGINPCWIPGTNTFAPISGVGFDIQLNQFGLGLGPWSVTFEVFGATPGCAAGAADGTNTVADGSLVPFDVDCYDAQNQQMGDGSGADTSYGCDATDPDYLNCLQYNNPNVQLLGTVTLNSDSNGDPAFFGFTTTDPYGIGALVMTGFSVPFPGEDPDANFSIDEVSLLTPLPPSTPEPATLLLFGSGLLIAARRLRKRATK